MQECYLRAFRHFDTFRGGPIRPWLFAILRNVCHAAYAGDARLVFTAEAGETQRRRVERGAETPERQCCARHESETMRRLIGELPAEFREAIVLREINDLSYREIADGDRGAGRDGDVAAGARPRHVARRPGSRPKAGVNRHELR